MKEFFKGFVEGARQTPKGYFAPAVVAWRGLAALWRKLVSTTDELTARKQADREDIK